MIRLLIVEDDTNTLDGLLELLGQDGYEARGATHGRQAIEMFEVAPDDIILCDYRLPDIDGLEVCARLKEIKPDVKLIMITAFSSGEIATKAKALGVYKIINKPIALDTLFAALENVSADLAKKNPELFLV